MTSIDATLSQIDDDTLRLVPVELVRRHLVLPINQTGPSLTLAMADPTDTIAMDDVQFATGLKVEPVQVSERAIRRAIREHCSTLKRKMNDAEFMRSHAGAFISYLRPLFDR